MKKITPLQTMNFVIVTALIWYFIDPNLTSFYSKLHLSIAGLFLVYKFLTKYK